MAQVVGLLLLLGTAALGYLAFRRVRLMRRGGVDVCLRRRRAVQDVTRGVGWHFGVGRYRGDELAWHRLTSFRPGATVVIDRTALEIVGRRPPTGAETYVIPQARTVLRCRSGGEDLELAMAPGVLTGFLAWLEATPPGRATGYRQAS
ncbi:MAG: DUF2550 domain-containing protein [Pseudonocardia sp.]